MTLPILSVLTAAFAIGYFAGRFHERESILEGMRRCIIRKCECMKIQGLNYTIHVRPN